MIPILKLGFESFRTEIGLCATQSPTLWAIKHGSYVMRLSRRQFYHQEQIPKLLNSGNFEPQNILVEIVTILLKVVENLRSWFQAVFSHKLFRVALNSLCKYRPSLTQGQFPGNAIFRHCNLFTKPIFCVPFPCTSVSTSIPIYLLCRNSQINLLVLVLTNVSRAVTKDVTKYYFLNL